jgi:hypothetical protein
MSDRMRAGGTRRRNPILVTGAHRSGSTWVGRMIAASGDVHYLHEPFNPKAFDPRMCEIPFEREFTFVCCDNATHYEEALGRCLEGAPLSPRDPASSGVLPTLRMRIPGRAPKLRALMKDPHAVFSAEWLADTFDMDVVMLVRHPAAFVGSLKKAQWAFRFDQLLEQPLLMTRHLEALRSRIEDAAHGSLDIVDQGILLWNAIYGVVAGYRDRRPEWIFRRHEDLSRDPARAFEELFETLGLRFTRRAKREVERRSRAGNPIEPQAGDPIRRDSRANLGSWLRRLTPHEIERVRKGTEDVARHFYGDEEWSPPGDAGA